MGTRNLTIVAVDGQYKVAQYGQWDGYPSGQGATALRFLREQFDRRKFLDRLAATFEPTEEQIKQWWLDVGHDVDSSDGFVEWGKARQFGENHPSLSRDTGAKILALIQDSTEPVPLQSAIAFAADSLFCEWAYVIDLDKNTFEVFRGFNKEPLPEGARFADLDKQHADYEPVRLVASFSLDALPDEAAFIKATTPLEDEE